MLMFSKLAEWFEKFKKQSGIYSVVRLGEAVNQEAAEEFMQEFSDYIKADEFLH